MSKILIFILLAIALIIFPTTGFSQEDDTEAIDEEIYFTQQEDTPQELDVEYVYGAIAEVRKNSNELVITEYDKELNEETKVVYSVDNAVEVENIDSWENLSAGSYVEVEYVTGKDGKRMISYIVAYDMGLLESDEE